MIAVSEEQDNNHSRSHQGNKYYKPDMAFKKAEGRTCILCIREFQKTWNHRNCPYRLQILQNKVFGYLIRCQQQCSSRQHYESVKSFSTYLLLFQTANSFLNGITKRRKESLFAPFFKLIYLLACLLYLLCFFFPNSSPSPNSKLLK